MENQADYQISTSVNEGILEIIMTGEFSDSAAGKLTSDLSAITKANNIAKVLVNVSALHGRLSIADTYLRVRDYPPHMYRILFAMVDITQKQDEYERFHEITAQNAGMRVKWFADADEARAWLKSK